ncbi:hypothetical protein M430DRAFT_185594 [Amorphotheca resinae ATCC 22711]|uniref:SCP domain-containing protein n=1 Tax=Amorphotheca resinae ATCC 22711 TaxID=857342 RepID=A0A2T3ASL4_AMORE|nr:hypothetical protein M430DRAFT_185594 [Amorphotheca resinae ATCC 22711]PSS09333.1 hypothetical protein M430DRAFT_185594 [Amorphotheca resinae ATCC 22711]
MRSSSFLALLGAALAVASPVHMNLHKKAIAWDIVTDIVTVTVTEGAQGSSTPSGTPTTVVVKHTVYANPIEDSAAKAVAIPSSTWSSSSVSILTSTSTSTSISTSTSAPPPPPPAPPAPTSTSAAPATIEAPAVVETKEAAPVAPSKPVVAEAVNSPAANSPAVSSPSVAAAPAPSPTDYSSAAVHYHNQHRSNHSAPAIAWNQTLADWAANTASTCVFKHDMTQGTGNYGQNIDATGSSNPIGDWDTATVVANSIVNDWYYGEYLNFVPYYNNPSPPDSSSTPEYLHFTQLVWKESQTVGCASHYCPQNSVLSGDFYGWYTVCNYFPVGKSSPLQSEAFPPNQDHRQHGRDLQYSGDPTYWKHRRHRQGLSPSTLPV